ncbi:MAG: ACT domain-containing protein [Actinomycetota bacterium]|nr:ACT domain-containing protein [Actinomycetota bacterium]
MPEGVAMEPGWRRLEVQGPLPFTAVGVLADLAAALSQAEIPIFTISTYETDHLLMKEDHLDLAVRALGSAGHRIAPEGQPSEGSP